MDKNTLSGLALMALVIFLFMWLNKPSEADREAARQAAQQAVEQQATAQEQAVAIATLTQDEVARLAPTVRAYGKPVEGMPGTFQLKNNVLDLTLTEGDSLSQVSGTVKVGNQEIDVQRIIANNMIDYSVEQADQACRTLRDAISTLNKYKSFAPFVGGDNQDIVLENDQLRVTIGSLGGNVKEVVLKKYQTETTTPPTDIVLFNQETASYGFTFATSDQRINTKDLNFKPVAVNDTTVTMSLPLAKDVDWQIRYTLKPDFYLVTMEILQNGIEAVIPPSTTTMAFDWALRMPRFEKGRTFEERNSSVMYKMASEGPGELNAGKNDDERLTGRIKWIGFKNQFFTAAIIARKNFTIADVASIPLKESSFVKDMSLSASLQYNLENGCPQAFDFYFGPNSYPLLSKLDDHLAVDGEENLQLNRLVPLGWGLFRWINQLITIPVFNFLSKFIHNYGIIILLLTLFIKIILFPFQYKSLMSQAKMRVLAPEIKEINEKYPGQENAMKRQQETMALYSKVGASPFSGCLPMMLQMPVYIAMFAFFPSAIELRGQSFLWAHDLSAPDSILTLPFSIPFYGDHVSLFCLLMTVVNILYMRTSMQTQPGGDSMPGMKWMMYLMPVMFLFIFNDYASGLSYYYFLSLLITILQTYLFRKIVDEKKVRQQMLENAKKPRKKSGFMARLEEAQKRQEAMMREQARQNAKKRR